MRNRKWTKTGICKDCEVYKNCGGGALHMWDEKRDAIKSCIYQQIQ
jgi:radical SAM protein with 4Fe4S-binding SPASM domain